MNFKTLESIKDKWNVLATEEGVMKTIFSVLFLVVLVFAPIFSYFFLVFFFIEKGYNVVVSLMLLVPTFLWLQDKILQLIDIILDKIRDNYYKGLAEVRERQLKERYSNENESND